MKAIACLIAALVLVTAQEKPPQPPQQQQPQPPAEQQKPLREGQVPLWKLSEDQLRFRPSEPIRGSVLTSTKLMLDALLAREPATAGVHFAPFTTIIYKSSLPSGGVYKGWLGLMDFIGRGKLTFNLNSFSYSIPFVDEARGFSVVKCKYSGKFVRTGNALESSTTMYLKWQFGKLRKVYIVDDNVEAVLNAYHTPAERVVSEFYNSLFECGDCAGKFLADNIKTTVRMYPKSAGDKLSYEGINEFKKRVGSPEANLMLNQIQGIRYLYGSDDTVVALIKLGPGSPATRIAGALGGRGHGVDTNVMTGSSSSDVSSLRDLAAVTIFKVKDGKIATVNSQLNQALMPWHVRQLGLFAEKKKADIDASAAKKAETKPPADQKKA